MDARIDVRFGVWIASGEPLERFSRRCEHRDAPAVLGESVRRGESPVHSGPTRGRVPPRDVEHVGGALDTARADCFVHLGHSRGLPLGTTWSESRRAVTSAVTVAWPTTFGPKDPPDGAVPDGHLRLR